MSLHSQVAATQREWRSRVWCWSPGLPIGIILAMQFILLYLAVFVYVLSTASKDESSRPEDQAYVHRMWVRYNVFDAVVLLASTLVMWLYALMPNALVFRANFPLGEEGDVIADSSSTLEEGGVASRGVA